MSKQDPEEIVQEHGEEAQEVADKPSQPDLQPDESPEPAVAEQNCPNEPDIPKLQEAETQDEKLPDVKSKPCANFHNRCSDVYINSPSKRLLADHGEILE